MAGQQPPVADLIQRFPGIRPASVDFREVRDGRRAPLFYVDVDLSTARAIGSGSQLVLPLGGNFLYVDQRANTGFATVRFEDGNVGSPPVTIFAGALWKVPFTRITIENAAQAGQTLRLFYGADVDALPISAAGVTVLNALNINDLVESNAQFIARSSTPGVGTTVATLLAPASNTAGFRIRSVQLSAYAGGGGGITGQVMAASAAPATVWTSQSAAILLGYVTGGSTSAFLGTSEFTYARTIPAGWGIYELVAVTGAAGGLQSLVSGAAL